MILKIIFVLIVLHVSYAANLFVEYPSGNDANACLNATSPCATLGRAVTVALPGDVIYVNYLSFDCATYIIPKDLVIDFIPTLTVHNLSSCNVTEYFSLKASISLTIQNLKLTSPTAPLVRAYDFPSFNVILKNITWSFFNESIVASNSSLAASILLTNVLLEKNTKDFVSGVSVTPGPNKMRYLGILDSIFTNNLGYVAFVSNIERIEVRNTVIQFHTNTRIIRINNANLVQLHNITSFQNIMGGISVTNSGQVIASNMRAIGNTRNLGASRGGAAMSLTNVQQVNIYNSLFHENQGNLYGGAVYVSEAAYIEVTNSTFSSNSVYEIQTYSGGGGLYANSSIRLVLRDCTFFNNTSEHFAGGAYLFEVQTATFERCIFDKNTGTTGGGVRAFKMDNFTIIDSEFLNNVASERGGALLLREVVLQARLGNSQGAYIVNTKFLDNRADKEGGAIAMISENNVHIQRSIFSTNIANFGAALYLSGSAVSHITVGSAIFIETEGFSVQDTIFEYNLAPNRGGAIYSASTEILMIISRSTFQSNTAQDGGSIYLLSRLAKIADSNFIGAVAYKYGGCIYSSQSSLELNNTNFISCNSEKEGGAMHINSRSVVSMTNTVFLSSRSEVAPAIMCADSDCSIRNTRIEGSIAKAKCGGISIKGFSKFHANRLLLERNKVEEGMGGAMCIEDGFVDAFTTIHLQNVQFIKNTALQGGAMFMNNEKQVTMFNVVFDGNIANIGGTVFALSSDKTSFDWNAAQQKGNITILSSNATIYGNLFASAPNSISLDAYSVEKTQTIVDPSFKFISCYPGQLLTIEFAVKDRFNQDVIEYPNFIIKILEGQYILQSSSLEQTISNGRIRFSDVAVFGKFGSTVYLQFRAVDPLQNEVIPVKNIPIFFSTCPAGYAIKSENSTLLNGTRNSCRRCEEGTYSIAPGQTNCTKCPENAYCFSQFVISNRGYWTYYDTLNTSRNFGQATVHYCLNQRCKGSNLCENQRNPEAPLCAACLPGYSEWNGSCVKCESVNGGFMLLFLLFLFGLTMLEHISSQTRKTASFKILFFYGQTMTLIVGSSDFIAWIRMFFEFEFTFLSGSSEGCPFPRDSYLKIFSNFIQSSALYMILLIMLVITSIIRCVACSIQKTYQVASKPRSIEGLTENLLLDMAEEEMKKKQVIDPSAFSFKVNLIKDTVQTSIKDVFLAPDAYLISCVGLLVLTYQELAKVGFSYFACMRIGSSRYLYHSTDIQCFTSRYFQWMPFYIILSLYAIFFPFMLLAFLVIAKKKQWLYNESFAHIFGNLYMTYKPQYYWYESVALLRRTIIIISWTVSQTVIQDQWPGAQFNVIAVLLIALLAFQRRLRPYIIHSENIADEYAILVLIFVALVRSSYSFEQKHLFSQLFLMVIAIGTAVGLFLWALYQNKVIRKIVLTLKSIIIKFVNKIRGKNEKVETIASDE